MHLKSLELLGFKSFAKKSVVDFTSSITAIVGPNGSGKSNIAEAFRFVLGEQSIKSLRGKRGEDLIFNGSKDTGRYNRASVKAIFDNSKRLVDVDFDEVLIERVVHRDGINEYLVNGSEVRLKNIIELLAKAHIGSSGHYIISQGEADRILSSNLKERKEIIEDALGLKIYQYKKKESERKLEKTEENISSIESLHREIQPHLKFLKKQVEKIEKTLEMKKELKELFKEYFKREEYYLKFERKKIEEEKKIPQNELDRLENELKNVKEILSQSVDKDKKSAETVELENKLRIVRGETETVGRNIGRLEGMIDVEEKRLIKLENEKKLSDGKLVFLSEVEILGKEVDEEILKGENTEKIDEIKNIFGKIRQLINLFISKNRPVDDSNLFKETRSEIEKIKKEKDYFESKSVEIKKRESDFNAEYLKLKEEIEKEKDINRNAEKAVFRIMAEQNEFFTLLNSIKSREEKIFFEEEDFKKEIHIAVELVGRQIADYQDMPLQATEEKNIQIERKHKIEKYKIRLEDLGGWSGEEVMKEFQDVNERNFFLIKELEDLRKSAELLKNLIKDLDVKLDEEFKIGLTKINEEFQKFFSIMFGGGSARLEVVKEKKKKRAISDTEISDLSPNEMEIWEEIEEEEGIDVSINLPHKKTKGLIMLSGGERALTSIALLFALSQVNPPPFIILDETDAALDEANSKKYSEMVKNLSKFSQLIVVTHNRETMSCAGMIYGVTMGSDGVSKLLSVNFEEAAQVAK